MHHEPRSTNRRTLIATAGVLVATCALGPSPASASSTPPLDCEPVACAAAYIGVATGTLAGDIAKEARRTGTIGTQVAIDQLNTATSRHLTAIPVTPDGSVDQSVINVITRHQAIHGALLHQAVTALRGALGA